VETGKKRQYEGEKRGRKMFRFGIGVLLFMIASTIATSNVSASGPEQNVADLDAVPRVRVLVAKKNLALGTVIKDPQKYFSEVLAVPSAVPKAPFHPLSEVKNLKLKKPIAEGQCLTPDYILTNEDALTLVIPPGHVAITLTINPEAIVGGCVLPMDRCDLILTIEMDDGSSSSATILTNALILATDTAAASSEKGTKLSMTVTLAVLPRQVRRLKELSMWGDLRLFLAKQK
jgi:pilus assembly protein CpaB